MPAASEKLPPMPAAQAAGSLKPELTFAARVQPASATSQSPTQQQDSSHTGASHSESPSPAGAAAPKKAGESRTFAASSDNKAQTAEPAAAEPGAAPARVAAAFDQGAHVASPPTAAPAPAAKPVEAAAPAEPVVSPVKAAPQPLKEVSFEVAPAGAQKVEVRMVQQAGEVRVAVRTADPELAHGLRDGLPDLVGRLQENGSRAEAWRPAAAAIATAPQTAQTGNSAGRGQSGDTPSHHSQQQERDQQQRQSSSRPQWVDELESSLTGASRAQGELLWHPQ